MNNSESDALVFFGATGDLAFKKIFPARQGVEDDHMNLICIGGRTLGPAVAWDLVQTFLAAEFSQAKRHLRRLGKVSALEAAGHVSIPRDSR